QVGEVASRKEVTVLDFEEDPDRRQPAQYRGRSGLGAHEVPGPGDPGRQPGSGVAEAGALPARPPGPGPPGAHRGPSSGSVAAPVIAATIFCESAVARSNTPAFIPSRSTQILSATAKTSGRLCEITTTARPLSESVLMSRST